MHILMLRAGVDADAVVQEFNLKPKFIYRHALNGFAAPMDSNTVERLKHDNRVRAVGDNGDVRLACSIFTAFLVPASSIATQQVPAGILRMGLTNFPMTRLTGQDHRINVDVAVLDSGVQLDHPDLNVYLPGSASFADSSANGSDWNGHGTHVAGIFGALDNDIGVVGVAPGIRLWSVQIIGPNEHGLANVLAGVDYVAQHADQISVVNCSFIIQAEQNYDILHEAFSNLVSHGVVVVAGAGNNSNDTSADLIWGNEDDNLPAALPEVMTVSAMDPNPMWRLDSTNCVWLSTNNPAFDQIAKFSNFSEIRHDPEFVHSPGGAIDVAAPGVYILSTYKGGDYALLTGTSMSTPHVAGLVPLYIAANGRATNAEGVYKIRQAIVNSSLPQVQWNPGGQPAHYITISPGGFDELILNTYDPDVYGFCVPGFCNTNDLAEPLAVPSEDWIPKPDILSAQATAQGFQLGFTTVPGYRYTVQYSEMLASSNQWNDLTSTNGSGSSMTANLTDPAPNATARFYRLLRQPTP